jgi:membrane protease YdiL (CAAX protease family)
VSNRSPLFCFTAFLLALAVSLVIAAALAPAVQGLIAPVKVAPLHRVMTRLAEVGLFASVWWLLRKLQLFDRALLGFSPPLAVFLRRALIAFLLGLGLMVGAVLPLFALDLREIEGAQGAMAATLLAAAPQALMTGIAVALIEETFFRGALQGAMTRSGAWRAALFAVPAFYAAVHFLGKAVRIPYEEVTATSGFTVLASFFVAFADPASIADAFLALYLVGLLLGIVRWYTGDIAACMGLHAGFVAVIVLMRKVSVHAEGGTWGWMVGSYDGLLGLWIAMVSALACLVALAWFRRGAVRTASSPRSTG